MRTSRAARRLGWLLAGVAMLAALSAWQWQRKQAARPDTLLALAPASVREITLTRHGQPTQHYVKHGENWFRQMPTTEVRADNDALHALAALASTPVLEWRDAADFDLAHIGLAQPPVVVSLDGHRLAWGGLTAFGPQRFVQVGTRVAVVPAQFSPGSNHPHIQAAPAASSSASSSQKS